MEPEKPAPITRSMWNRVVRIVRRRIGGTDEAEDLVQEAYLRLLGAQQQQPVDNPEGFLIRTAQNVAISEIRKTKVRTLTHADHAIQNLFGPSVPTPDEVFSGRERLKAVDAALLQLPPRAREVFVAHRVDGKSYSVIAEELGISVSAVEKNMARALTHLTLRLQDFRRKHDKAS